MLLQDCHVLPSYQISNHELPGQSRWSTPMKLFSPGFMSAKGEAKDISSSPKRLTAAFVSITTQHYKDVLDMEPSRYSSEISYGHGQHERRFSDAMSRVAWRPTRASRLFPLTMYLKLVCLDALLSSFGSKHWHSILAQRWSYS